MPGYSHTVNVRRDGKVVARCCSFLSTPLRKGRHWNFHKGKLLQKYQTTSTVVKIFHGPDRSVSSAEALAEEKKFSFAAKVFSNHPRVKLTCTYHSVIDKIGKGCKLSLSESSRKENMMVEGVTVVIQDFVDGGVGVLLDIEKNNQKTMRSEVTENLLKLVNDSYRISNGQCVIGALKGVKVADRDSGSVIYVTSLTIHSRNQEYGHKDKGVKGIQVYENWTGRRVPACASAPPMESPQVEKKGCRQSSETFPVSPFPSPKFRVSPIPPSYPINSGSPSISLRDLTSHLALLAGKEPEIMNKFPEKLLNKLWGLPPTYSSM